MLDIFIPTYNRSSDILFFLSQNILNNELIHKVYIMDNNSNDDTRLTVASFRNEKFIFVENTELLSAQENFLRCLKYDNGGLPKWIVGDRYILPSTIDLTYFDPNSFNIVLLDDVVNGVEEIIEISDLINSYNFFKILRSISCISTIIYPSNFYLDYDQFLEESTFPHTYIVLNSISQSKFKLVLLPFFSIKQNSSSSNNWSYKTGWYKIGVVGWVEMIKRLDNHEVSKFTNKFTSFTTLGSFTGITKQFLLNLLNEVDVNDRSFKLGYSFYSKLLILFYKSVPKNITNFVRKLFFQYVQK